MSDSSLNLGFFTPIQQRTIIERLQSRGAASPCSRCGKQDFLLGDGVTYIGLQKPTPNIVVPSPASIPAVTIICNNCGYITTHALGALKLLDHPAMNLGE